MRDPGRSTDRQPALEPGRLTRLVVVALGVLGFSLLPGFASSAVAGLHEAAAAKSILSGGKQRTAGQTRTIKRAELAPAAHQRSGAPAPAPGLLTDALRSPHALAALGPVPATAAEARHGTRPHAARGRAPPFPPGS